MDRRLLLYLLAYQDSLATKSMTTAERDSADAYMGPGKSFPVFADGRQLREAWDMAGHAADPGEVRANCIRFAKLHNLLDKLPADAEQQAEHGKEDDSDADDAAKKAQTVVTPEGDGILVAKGFSAMKAWSGESGDVNIEGWISTEGRDQQKDVVPPEAFKAGMREYLLRAAPLTSEHQMYPSPDRGIFTRYPIGHMQRIALVRDGVPFDEGVHPTDSQPFTRFTGTGTGVYGRGVINEAAAAGQVMKGNLAGFSWVGRVKEYQPLPDGGRRFGRIEPWMETTLAAFPVNSQARLLLQTRQGAQE